MVDVVRVMETLAEQGITVLIKADAERMRDGVRPWTFVATGVPFHEDLLVRTDAVSVVAITKTPDAAHSATRRRGRDRHHIDHQDRAHDLQFRLHRPGCP